MRSRPRRSRRALPATTALLGLTALAPRVDALELEFEEPAPCRGDEIAFRVERAITEPLASISGPTYRVSIEKVAAGYVGQVHVSSEEHDAQRSSERRVTAASCDELVDTLALTLVLAIAGQRDAKVASTAPEATRAAAVEEPAARAADLATSAAENRDEALAVESSAASGAGLAAFGAMVGDAGSLPAFGLGVAVGADVTWPSVELRALGMLFPGAEGVVDRGDAASPGAEIGLAAGALLICAPLSGRALGAEVAPCVGAELGRLSGHGTRIDTSRSSSRGWAAPRADFRARWALPLRWLALELGVTVAAPIWRDEFVLEGVGSVHRAGPVVGRTHLSVRAELGR